METRLGIDAWIPRYVDDETGEELGVDFRLEATADGKTFSGYAAVFDQRSKPFPGGWQEVLAPGAFKRSLNQRKRDLKAFVNHDHGRLLGTRHGGTLELKEDDYGLRNVIALPDTQDGRDVGVLTSRGDIFAQSFGFGAVDVQHMDNGKTRVVREAVLLETSPLTAWPAYDNTTAGVRHLAAVVEVEEDELAKALAALTSDDGELTAEQRALLERAVVARSPKPIDTPLADEWRQRLDSLAGVAA